MLTNIKKQLKKINPKSRKNYNSQKCIQKTEKVLATSIVKPKLFHYKMMGQIGEGGCAKIFQAKDTLTEKMVAIKQVKVRSDYSKNLLQNEIETMKASKNIPGIVKLYDTFQKEDETELVMELINGWCLQTVVENVSLDSRLIAALCKNILTSISKLHEENIVHRDIKCGNIMIDTEGNTKIIDFGYATFIPEKGCILSGRVGSLYWMAPEIYKKEAYNEKCDIWSFGIAILEMITGDPPYYATRVNKEELIHKLTHGIIPIPKDIPQNMSSFIRKCLKENPNERWSAKELLAHPFLQESVSLKYLIPAVTKCLESGNNKELE